MMGDSSTMKRANVPSGIGSGNSAADSALPNSTGAAATALRNASQFKCSVRQTDGTTVLSETGARFPATTTGSLASCQISEAVCATAIDPLKSASRHTVSPVSNRREESIGSFQSPSLNSQGAIRIRLPFARQRCGSPLEEMRPRSHRDQSRFVTRRFGRGREHFAHRQDPPRPTVSPGANLPPSSRTSPPHFTQRSSKHDGHIPPRIPLRLTNMTEQNRQLTSDAFKSSNTIGKKQKGSECHLLASARLPAGRCSLRECINAR